MASQNTQNAINNVARFLAFANRSTFYHMFGVWFYP